MTNSAPVIKIIDKPKRICRGRERNVDVESVMLRQNYAFSKTKTSWSSRESFDFHVECREKQGHKGA